MTPENSAPDPGLRQRLPLYPGQFLIAMAIVSLGPLLDPMMRDLGISLSRGGLVSAGLFLGNVSGIVMLNTAMAKLPAKRTLVGAITLQGVGLTAAGLLSWNLWSLFVAYLFVGFAGSLINTTGWMWVSAHIKRDRAAAALRLIMFFAFAMMIVPLLVGVALDAGAYWRWVLATEGVLALVVAATVSFLPLLDVAGRRNIRLAQFREVIGFDRWLLLGMVIAGFTYVGAEMTMNVWLPKFQIEVFGAADTLASFSVTLFWVGLIVGRLIIMALTKRFSAARLLLISVCVLAVFAVAVAFAPTRTVSLILAVGAGLGASASYGLIGSYAGRFPGWQSTVASSLFIVSGALGGVAFPYIMGPLADSAGFRIALAMVAVPSLACAAASLLIYSRAPREG